MSAFIFCCDTETSGLPIFDKPSDDPRQPFIVTLGLLLIDAETLEEITAKELLLRPPAGREIPTEATKIHGITTERAVADGTDPTEAMIAYADYRRRCAALLGHNVQFDQRMCRIELLRTGKDKPWIEALEASSPVYCTQKLSTPVLKLEPTARMKAVGRNHFKSASLKDCIRGFFDEDVEGAHGALADCRSAARVFRHLRGLGHV